MPSIVHHATPVNPPLHFYRRIWPSTGQTYYLVGCEPAILLGKVARIESVHGWFALANPTPHGFIRILFGRTRAAAAAALYAHWLNTSGIPQRSGTGSR